MLISPFNVCAKCHGPAECFVYPMDVMVVASFKMQIERGVSCKDAAKTATRLGAGVLACSRCAHESLVCGPWEGRAQASLPIHEVMVKRIVTK